MKIGIYSGSFNPIHLGHVALASYMIDNGIVDEVWLIRSPQNPLKSQSSLLDDEHRLQMLNLVALDNAKFKICSIEDELPKPSYTINTLRALKSQFPEHDFYLIVGGDNWSIFNKWKDWESILRDFHLIVYPRPNVEIEEIDSSKYPTVQIVNAPLYDISSTQIREAIVRGDEFAGWVPERVAKYIVENDLYK